MKITKTLLIFRVCFLNDYKCIISLVIMNEMQHSVFLLCLTEHEILKVLMDIDIEKKISFFLKQRYYYLHELHII